MESINDDFYGEIIELAKAIKEQKLEPIKSKGNLWRS